MSEHRPPREDTDEGVVQIDLYGIKTKVKPANKERDPRTWADVWKRVHANLKKIAAGVPSLLAVTIEGASQLIRGVCAIPSAIANRIERAHRKADTHEVFRQRQSATVEVAKALEQIEAILEKYRANGHLAQLYQEGGRVFLVIGRPEIRSVATEIAQQDLLSITYNRSIKPENLELLSKPIADLGLPPRVTRYLDQRLSMKTIADLVRLTADELLEYKGFGPKMLKDVRDRLDALGINLSGD